MGVKRALQARRGIRRKNKKQKAVNSLHPKLAHIHEGNGPIHHTEGRKAPKPRGFYALWGRPTASDFENS